LRELGQPFAEVHAWLDELQPEYGPLHRRFRHHTDGVDRIRAKWGEQAAAAAVIHVRRDCGNRIPRPEDYRGRGDEPEPESVDRWADID
jgi:DNA-binding GntR family transcriptional regulator